MWVSCEEQCFPIYQMKPCQEDWWKLVFKEKNVLFQKKFEFLIKSWDEMKDLIQLKLCNANINTYTSHFMEIQQWEKESLAAYIH